MKKVTTNQFIDIAKEEVRKVSEGSATKSIRGEFMNVAYLVSSVLKNGYYAKNQENKSDKNPFWGMDITAIKEYNAQVGTDYAKQREKDGFELSDDYVSPFNSIIANLIFQHKESGAYYIQVMSKAHKSTTYLNGEVMCAEDKAILDRYKKPYKEGYKSEDYKKLRLDKVLSISLNGEVYEIDNTTTYINLSKENEKVAVAYAK